MLVDLIFLYKKYMELNKRYCLYFNIKWTFSGHSKTLFFQADGEELETECSICWDDPRDTLILPCRHLAVCSECAEKIRYQQAACPICRKPFKALLKLEISAKNNPTDESFSGNAL